MQWGKRLGRSVHDPAPKRPDIRGTVDRHRDELEQQYLRDVAAAFRPAFDSTEP